MPPRLSYWTVQPDRWTFGAQKLRNWVESQIEGRVLNACAGQTHLDHKGTIVRNDITPEIDADYHGDVRSLPDVLEAESFDVIVLDPPFSERQSTTTYGRNNTTLPSVTELARVVDALLKPGGRVIRLGYTTTLMSPGQEYMLEEVAVWNTLGRQHDWLGVVARKPARGETPATRPLHATDAAVPNTGATASGGVATSGNGNTPIDLEYIRLAPKTPPEAGVTDYVASHLSGRVLDVSTHERSLLHDGHLVQTSVDDTVDAAYHFDERELSAEFAAGIFQTVLVDLPSEAFQQTTEYAGSMTGRDTALKQEVHPLIAAGGQIIQVGHTATCMPQRLDYRRSRVAVIELPTSGMTGSSASTRSRPPASTSSQLTAPHGTSTSPTRTPKHSTRAFGVGRAGTSTPSGTSTAPPAAPRPRTTASPTTEPSFTDHILSGSTTSKNTMTATSASLESRLAVRNRVYPPGVRYHDLAIDDHAGIARTVRLNAELTPPTSFHPPPLHVI